MRRTWIGRIVAAAAVIAAACAALAGTVFPLVASIGAEVELSGITQPDFAPRRKPKVELRPSQAFPLPVVTTVKTKVLDYAADAIRVRVVKGVAGAYDVFVTPAEGTTPFSMGSVFFIGLPVPQAVVPRGAPSGAKLLVSGSLFGTQRGVVTVGGRKAKVKRWTDTAIECVLPKRMTPGLQAIVVSNRAGVSTAELSVLVEETQPGGVDEFLDAQIEGRGRLRATERGVRLLATYDATHRQLTVSGSSGRSGFPALALSFTPMDETRVPPYDVTLVPDPEHGTTAAASYLESAAKVRLASGANAGSSLTVHVARWDGIYFEGSFEGVVVDSISGGDAVGIAGTFRVRPDATP